MKKLALPDAQTSGVIESPSADLPAVAKEAEDAWSQIEQSNLGERMKSALRRIACGESIRGSAEARGTARTLMSTATPSSSASWMSEPEG